MCKACTEYRRHISQDSKTGGLGAFYNKQKQYLAEDHATNVTTACYQRLSEMTRERDNSKREHAAAKEQINSLQCEIAELKFVNEKLKKKADREYNDAEKFLSDKKYWQGMYNDLYA